MPASKQQAAARWLGNCNPSASSITRVGIRRRLVYKGGLGVWWRPCVPIVPGKPVAGREAACKFLRAVKEQAASAGRSVITR